MNSLKRYLEDRGKSIRDPVWEYIYLSSEMMALVDTEDFQRLRDISQLGHVSLVYPGARHSRFEHSLGVYHLTKQFLRKLMESDPPLQLCEEDIKVCLAAALLHDIGHYPFSHILEEMNMCFFEHHEARGRKIICDQDGSIYRVLENDLNVSPERVANVIDYKRKDLKIPKRDLELARILSGTLDPDKIDYLLRDSLFCGVPFGASVNRLRLIDSIKYDAERSRLAVSHKGVSAIESLIFTNYLMYRNVYWHHGVRSAVAMFKRSLQEILLHPLCKLKERDFIRISESELLSLMSRVLDDLSLDRAIELFQGALKRRLFKVGREIYPQEKKGSLMEYFLFLYQNPGKRREKEEEMVSSMQERLGRKLAPASILIDIPCFAKSLEIDLKVFMKDSARASISEEFVDFGDPSISSLKSYLIDNFEENAKVFRVFCEDDAELLEVLGKEMPNLL